VSDSSGEVIRWRIHLRSAPEQVFIALATPEGRAAFWAESAEEVPSSGAPRIEFRFSGGQRLASEVLEATAPGRYRLTYFGGSVVTFEIESAGDGGTDLTLVEEDSPPEERFQNRAGWVAVLLALKASLDFGVDLRNHDPNRSWDHGFVDA
jgi:uncharacterized protein YndB with AHSA1/START domain